MLCPQCKMVEMRVEKVENNVIYLKCKKCGTETSVSVEELENQDE